MKLELGFATRAKVSEFMETGFGAAFRDEVRVFGYMMGFLKSRCNRRSISKPYAEIPGIQIMGY